MTLTVADIDRWDPGAIKAVSDAASRRGSALTDAQGRLGNLTVFDTWTGEASEASRARNTEIIDGLGRDQTDSSATGKAVASGASAVESIKKRLDEVRSGAAQFGITIDPASNKALPPSNFNSLSPEERSRISKAVTATQTAIDGIMQIATSTDQQLADALAPKPASENGMDKIWGDPPAKREIPSDPEEFEKFWNSLTPQEKDELYAQDHSIGNHGGMPFEDRDHYNRLHLQELKTQSENDLNRIKAEHPDWVSVADALNNPPKGPHNVVLPGDPGFAAWKEQYDAANRNLEGYKQIENALKPLPDPAHPGETLKRYLGTIDDKGHAAVSINNPDTAKKIATYVPGTGQDLARFQYSDQKSYEMYQATLGADKSLGSHDVSVTTWMGYDRPMSLVEAASPSYALGMGDEALDDFQAGVRASHDDAHFGRSENTVIGHSYGSTLVGAAASNGHHLDADNVIAVGSPGMLADQASQLDLNQGANVYATQAKHDVIGEVTGLTLGVGPTSSSFGATVFEAAPGPGWFAPGPFSDWFDKWVGPQETVAAHSSYWDPGNPALSNMGKVIAGHGDKVTPPHD